MLDTGDSAPDFSLSPADEPYAAYMLSAAAKEGPVVLAFIPSDPAEARPFLERLADIDWSDLIDSIAVYGIGTGSDAVRGLAESGDFPFPILADRVGYVIDIYEVATRSGGDPRRGLVLVNPLSSIEFSWEATDADETPPIDALKSAVASLSAKEDVSVSDFEDLPDEG
jgi:peroxiredoxin